MSRDDDDDDDDVNFMTGIPIWAAVWSSFLV